MWALGETTHLVVLVARAGAVTSRGSGVILDPGPHPVPAFSVSHSSSVRVRRALPSVHTVRLQECARFLLGDGGPQRSEM